MKKVVLLLISLAMVAGISVSSQATNARQIVVVGHTARTLSDNFSLGHSGDHLDLEVGPGDEIKIPLTADLFTWSNGRETFPGEAMNDLYQMYNGKVKLGRRTLGGSDVLDYVQLEMGNVKGAPLFAYGDPTTTTARTAYIKVKFVDDYATIDDQSFRFRIHLSIRGERYEELSLELAGEFKLDVDYVSDTMTEYDISKGEIIEAEDTVPLIDLDIGNGVVVHKYLNEGQRYYGLAYLTDSVDDVREEWPELYPDVASVVRIRHERLDKGISRATITPEEGGPFYVYNRHMEFVGMTGEQVPFSDLYFLSTSEIPTFDQDSYLDSLINVPVTPGTE